jgi:DNA-directed RNA polymerase specialized sigma24 family protein
MNGRYRYQQAARILRQVRQPERTSTPERLEENLRWLMQVTMPEAKASAALRQRVRALAEAHRAWLNAQRVSREELRRWQGLEAALAEPEREMLALLLTADLRRLAEDDLLREGAQQVTQRLLAALPEPLREALLLQVVQGLPTPEIAQVLGCSEDEATRLLLQARTSIFQQARRNSGQAPKN